MLAALIAIIIEFLLEFVFGMILEIIVELGIHRLPEVIRIPYRKSAVIEATGYAIVGAMLGGASVFIFPESFIGHPDLRILNLVVTPVLAGLVMMGIGAWRTKKGQDPIRLDSFAYGALFAFSLEIVRFVFVS